MTQNITLDWFLLSAVFHTSIKLNNYTYIHEIWITQYVALKRQIAHLYQVPKIWYFSLKKQFKRHTFTSNCSLLCPLRNFFMIHWHFHHTIWSDKYKEFFRHLRGREDKGISENLKVSNTYGIWRRTWWDQ